MIRILTVYGFLIDLSVRLWSIFYFPNGLIRRKNGIALRILSLVLFIAFLYFKNDILPLSTAGMRTARNLLVFLSLLFVLYTHYIASPSYLFFIGCVIFFTWVGWRTLFHPQLISVLPISALKQLNHGGLPKGLLNLGEAICRIACFLLFKATTFRHISSKNQLNWTEVCIALFPALLCRSVSLMLYDLINIEKAVLSSSLSTEIICIFAVLVICMPLFLSTAEYHLQYREKQRSLLLLIQQLHEQELLFEKNRENTEKIRALYHDYHNHLSTIQGMTNQQEVVRYVEELTKKQTEYLTEIHTGNLALDILINQKKSDCQKLQIAFDCLIDFQKVRFVSDSDLVILFANAIDNAMEAVHSLSAEERKIKVRGGVMGNCAVAKFSNPYQNELICDNGTYLTTKSDTLTHGIGLKNMERVLHKYNGHMHIETQDHTFTLQWLMPFHEDSNT